MKRRAIDAAIFLFVGPGAWLVVPWRSKKARRVYKRKIPFGWWWGYDDRGCPVKDRKATKEEIENLLKSTKGGFIY